MKQLSGMDAGFLYMETGSSFGHVSSLSVYSRPDDPTYQPFEAFRSQLASRLHLIEPFRRRLVQVPLGIDRPYWIADPDFDLDFHVRHLAIPAPGNSEQLADQIARIIGRPMDRARPLWEVYVIEGLEGGDFGVLTKVHHATIDGASGVELLSIMLDSEPGGTPVPPPVDEWTAEEIPSPVELLRLSAINLAGHPRRATRLGLRAMQELAHVARNADLANLLAGIRRRIPRLPSSEVRDRPPILPIKPAPGTPFNKMITAHRRFAMRSVSLADIKQIKNELDATVNDVVMAVCAGALRRYLESHDALPTEPLVAMVPVSIRSGDETDKWTNRVSALVAKLPTNIDDPVERVGAMHTTMTAAKQQFDMIPAELLSDVTQFATPALATRALRLVAATRIANRLSPPVNLVISNVPGPRQPLYLAGATMKHFFPVSTVVDGQGLNITVQSYLDTLDFGLVACRELVPDLSELADLCVEEVERLLAACTQRALVAANPDPAPRAARTAKRRPAARRPAARNSSARSAASRQPVRPRGGSTPGAGRGDANRSAR
jgi:diacylglycerol O-acyltransferase / wax synthase